MKRFINALKIAYFAYKNPRVFRQHTFKMLADLFELILKVSHEDRHMMTHIAFVHPEEGTEHQIVSIWAGAGAAAEPTKRIKELVEENSRLKLLLNQQIKD
jgi:hypothetical protein